MAQPYLTLSEILRAYWPIPLGALAVSLLATPLCRRFALKRGFVDRPDDFLKPHKKPIPYLGGVAIFLGWAAGVGLALVIFRVASSEQEIGASPSIYPTTMVGVLLAGLAIMALGLCDDLRFLSPRIKLAGNIAVALLLVAFGIGDEIVGVLTDLAGITMQPWLVTAYSVPITVFIVVGACNATNLIDGVDGLCSGVLGIISAGFLVVAVHMHLWSDWHPYDVHRVVLALAMLGAALGFLPFNRSPAKIFMGDAGSMLLGLNAAVLLLLFAKQHQLRWVMGSVMVFGLPVADMVLTLARRWRNERPLMEGDRSHFYDQLLDRGMAVRKVVAISYALAAFYALVGCATIWLRIRYTVPLYVLVVAATVVAISTAKMVKVERTRDTSIAKRPEQDP